jgi:hypothetical protein
MQNNEISAAPEQTDFSLVLGGPLYQLLLRAGLIQPSMALLYRRIVAAAVFTWLPLALLTALGGDFLSGVSVPFLYDLDVHIRFLIALPLLIGAEVIVHSRLRVVVAQFRERNLIAPEDRRAFENIISGAMRLGNSVTIEIILLVVAFVAFYGVWRSQVDLGVVSWYAASTHEAISFTWAGYWYVFVAVPIFRFMLLRWYFRIFVWYVFMFRVSRLRLQLEPLHADKAGGLEFLSMSVDAISPVLLAQSVVLSGVICNQIWHAGATLPDFQLTIGGFAAIMLLLVLLPLGFFVLPMAAAKRAALPELGALATRYASEFRQKWLPESRTRDKELLGSSDLQSLADLTNGYAVTHDMRLLPFGTNVVVRLVILIALPLLPLPLTMFPFEVILQQLIKFVM